MAWAALLMPAAAPVGGRQAPRCLEAWREGAVRACGAVGGGFVCGVRSQRASLEERRFLLSFPLGFLRPPHPPTPTTPLPPPPQAPGAGGERVSASAQHASRSRRMRSSQVHPPIKTHTTHPHSKRWRCKSKPLLLILLLRPLLSPLFPSCCTRPWPRGTTSGRWSWPTTWRFACR